MYSFGIWTSYHLNGDCILIYTALQMLELIQTYSIGILPEPLVVEVNRIALIHACRDP